MDEKAWQKIEELFNRTMELPASRRNAFLEEICRVQKVDAFTFEQVKTLVAAETKPSNEVLEQPAFPLFAKVLDTESETLLKKTAFATYKSIKILGRGGTGAVFLAEDTRLGRLVAVKILHPSVTGNKEILMRFEQEARLSSLLNHPNVAHIYEYGTFEGIYFLAMEYVPGRTLRDLIQENQIDIKSAADIALQIAEALNAAHEQGIMHRDIKPENVILTDAGTVKILDFGLAKLIEEKMPKRTSSVKTQAGVMLGTTAYMSPEQIRGKKIDARSDLWSLGVVFYEMLEGARPFGGETPSDIQASILLSDPEPLARTKNLPGIERFIGGALKKKRSERCPSARQAIADLRAVKQEIYDLEKKKEAGKGKLAYLGALLKRGRYLPVASLFFVAIVFAVLMLVNYRRTSAENNVEQIRKLTHALATAAAVDQGGKQLGAANRFEFVKQTIEKLDEFSAKSGDDRVLRLHLGRAFVSLGDLQGRPAAVNTGDAAGARASYERALQILENLRAEFPEDADVRRTLGLTYSRYGYLLHRRLGEAEAGVANLEKSLKLLEPPATDSPAPDKRDFSAALVDSGEVCLNYSAGAAGNSESRCTDFFSRAIEIRTQRAAENPSELQAKRDLVEAVARAGFPFRLSAELPAESGSRLAGSLAKMREALALAEKNASESGAAMCDARQTADIHLKIGVILLAANQSGEAAQHLSMARSAFQIIALTDSDDLEARLDLAYALFYTAKLESKTKESVAARENFRAALQIVQELLAKDSFNKEEERFLNFIQNEAK